MLNVKLEKVELFKKTFESLKDLITDANMDCSSDGLHLQSMDTAHVALVVLTLKASGFDSYVCKKNTVLGINMISLNTVLKCVSNTDSVELKYKEKSDVLGLEFGSKDAGVAKFNLKLLEIESEQLGIPESSYDAIVKMSSTKFKNICKNLSTMGEVCTITVTDGSVEFSTRGDTVDGSIILNQVEEEEELEEVEEDDNDDANDDNMEVNENGSDDGDDSTTKTKKTTTTPPVKSSTKSKIEKEMKTPVIRVKNKVSLDFALKFLSIISKPILAPNVTLHLSSEAPLAVKYRLGKLGKILYYLAPKLDEDDDDDEEK